MTDRDHFAAAALTGLLGSGDLVIDPRNGTATTLTVLDAYRWADAMLCERDSRTGQKMAESDSFRAVVPERDSTTNDGTATGEPGGSVGFSPGSRSGQINRTPERESPRRECGESSLRDVSRPDTKGEAAGGPEHHISEKEIDALEFVVEEGRIANIHDYGILRSLLIRVRQEWEFRDSPEPIAGCNIDRLKPVKDAAPDRPEPIKIDLSQPCMVDPPSGWKWGFPRRYDPASDGPMNEWLVRNGYPKHLADQGLDCTFTLCGNGEADK